MNEARSVLGVICSAYDSFFEAEKKIADYIMEHKDQAVDMTVGELAKASGTSDATVSRFCRRCGFKGFQNLKLTLAREILEEEHQSQEVTNDIDRTDLEQSLKNILANKIAELTETIKMIDIKNLEIILDKLEHARMVQLAAVGNTIPVALDGAFKFNQLGIPAVAGDIWEAQAAYAFNLDFRVYKTSVLEIGDNFYFSNARKLNPICRNVRGSVRIEKKAELIIGNNVAISSACIWVHEFVKIGNNVRIGGDCLIIDSDCHSLDYMDRRNNVSDKRNTKNKGIIIEDDVMIGARCIILKGVVIGARSIIGAGSVVTSAIPSDCVVAGNPARIIRRIND